MASFPEEENTSFESAIVDNFRCSLCLDVLRNPVQCQRNEHHFCRSCITRHLKQSKNCPSCKEDLSLETVRPASQILNKLLSQLKIRCDYHMRGCSEVMKVEELEKHHKVCDFAPVVCSNKDCSEVVHRKNQVHHETQACQFRLVECSVCGESLVSRWYKMHVCVIRSELDEVKACVKRIEDAVTQTLALVKPLDEVTFRGINQNIIVCGGQGSRYAEMYRWQSKEWVKQKNPSTFTSEHGISFLYKGKIFVTGVKRQGYYDDNPTGIATIAVQNFVEAYWQIGQASLPYKCYAFPTVLVQDHLLVLGGFQDSLLDGVHEVDLVPPYTFKLLSRMPEPRCHHGAGLFGDKVVVVGGQTEKGVSNEVLMYDLANNNWKKMAPLQTPVMKMATVCWKDNIILLGGQSTTNDKEQNQTSDVIMYNITTETFTKLPNMKKARSMCAAVIIGNTVVVMGGYGYYPVPNSNQHGSSNQYSICSTNTVEYFNLEKCSSWRELPEMNEARRGATAYVC